MKKILLFLLTLPFCMVYGQKSNKQTGFNKLTLGFNFSPDRNFRSLRNNDGSYSSDIVIKARNDIEIAKFGYTTGLNVCFNSSNLIKLESGIQYSNKGYKTINWGITLSPPDPSFPTKSKIIYSYHYIGIPAKVKFTFGKSKVRFFSSIGFLTNFLLNAKQTNVLEYSDGRKEKNRLSLEDFKKIDISSMISLGIEYKVNQKTTLIAEPTFRYGLLKTIDAPITENLWNTGLNIGFYYSLR